VYRYWQFSWMRTRCTWSDAGRENELGINILDATKHSWTRTRANWKMTLNRNVKNFFQKLNRSLFTQEILSGIDFSNDPSLRKTFFSRALQLHVCSKFSCPINRRCLSSYNYQRGGLHRQSINKGIAYEPTQYHNDIELRIDGDTVDLSHNPIRLDYQNRETDTFLWWPFFATLFWNSQSVLKRNTSLQLSSLSYLK
jgi:catalase